MTVGRDARGCWQDMDLKERETRDRGQRESVMPRVHRSEPQEIAHHLGDFVGLLELRGMSATIHGLQSGPGEAPHEFVGVGGRHEPVVLTPEE